MISNKKIAVVIPCFKVSNKIKDVLFSIPKFVDYIIVVDDHCPEKSGKIAEEVDEDKVHVIFHKKNKGVGGAVITGVRKSMDLKSDIIVKLDGDGQMDTKSIIDIIMPIIDNNANYTKGNRFFDFKALKNMPRIRLFGNSILSFVVKAASGYWHVMDPTNGFIAISAHAVDGINLNKIDNGFFFEIDLLINLNFMNNVVVDIPIPAIYKNEVSNLSVRSVSFTFPFKILNRIIKRIFLKYYIYNFNMASIYLLISIPLLLFGFIFGSYQWSQGIIYNTENNSGTIMLAALPIILGIQFLLQAISIDINDVPKK